MSESNSSAITQGFSSLGAMLLFITFLVLKLTGVIAWSWWWVTAPLWGGLAILLGIGVLVAVFMLACIPFGRSTEKKAAKRIQARMKANAGERNGDT